MSDKGINRIDFPKNFISMKQRRETKLPEAEKRETKAKGNREEEKKQQEYYPHCYE